MNDWRNIKTIIAVMTMMLLMAVVYCLMTGCAKTVKHMVEVHDTTYVEKVRTDTVVEHLSRTDTVYKASSDTVREYKVVRDSLVYRDSIYVKERGDSVFIYKEKWRTKYVTDHDTVYRSKTDTVYRSKTDTVFVYRFAEARDSVMQSKDSSELKVKEKRGWFQIWGKWVTVVVLLAVAGGIVWMIRKRGI